MEPIGPVYRTDMMEKYSASLLDQMVLHAECKACKKSIFDSTIRTIAFAGYRTPAQLGDQAKKLANASKGTKMKCECGREQSASAASYHAYHSGRKADLVARFEYGLFGVSGPKLLWWTGDQGYSAASDVDERCLKRDAAVRSIAVIRETQGIEAAFPTIEAALEEIPGDRALLDLIPRLLQVGKNSIAGAIVDAHRRLHPDDAEGWFWDGEITFRLINGRLWGQDKLPEAEASLKRALKLKPDHFGAQVTFASIARMRGDDAGAIAAYERLIETHPESDVPHYNLGAMFLESQAEKALAHFVAGEKKAPEDADYPVGCARALVRLGRRSEAEEALARGTKLNPDHPRIAEVRAALN
jgi:tetratricopeptide (TPR) repeat protein